MFKYAKMLAVTACLLITIVAHGDGGGALNVVVGPSQNISVFKIFAEKDKTIVFSVVSNRPINCKLFGSDGERYGISKGADPKICWILHESEFGQDYQLFAGRNSTRTLILSITSSECKYKIPE